MKIHTFVTYLQLLHKIFELLSLLKSNVGAFLLTPMELMTIAFSFMARLIQSSLNIFLVLIIVISNT